MKTLDLSETRMAKLRSDFRREARCNAQRRAISDALGRKGRKMFKVSGKAEFRVNDRYETPIYYESGYWTSPIESYQDLIDIAIAGI